MKLRITRELAEAAVLGGAFLGGGGGGDLHWGLQHADMALQIGELFLVDVDSIPQESSVLTASLVGAPASKHIYVTPSQMINSTRITGELLNGNVGGIVASENGGYSTINGWIQAAALGIPLIDAPANGRAHPTGIMGSMGLHNQQDYTSLQVAVGGDREKGRYVEVCVRGSLEACARLVREAAVQAGGLVAVTRNPVSAAYVKSNAACGAILQAIEIGKILFKYKHSLEEMIHEVIKSTGGRVVDYGTVINVTLQTKGGFDTGRIEIDGENGGHYELTFWNEYMTCEGGGKRMGTFPDLIVTIDAETALPLSTAEVKKDKRVALLVVPKEKLKLGSGMRDPEVLRPIEPVIEKKIL